MKLKSGDVFSHNHTFTREEVQQFGVLTGDQGRHHTESDSEGRVMVQGLLTASIATKIGGDLHYIAREMVSEFLRPVFTGDTITCDVTLTKVEEVEGRKNLQMKSIYTNQLGKVVMQGTSYGIIKE